MAKFKRCSVKLLSTGEPANSKGDLALHEIVTQIHRFHLYICSDSYPYNQDKLVYIYIISESKNEIINTGDWYYDTEDNKIGQLECGELTMSYDRRILATDNPVIALPRLPKGFIEKYVDSFDENKPIEEAMVEYVEVVELRNGVRSEIKDTDYKTIVHTKNNGSYDLRKQHGIFEILKVDKGKYITIKRVKDEYTREEVVDLLKRSYDLGRQDYIVSQDNGAYINTLYDWTEKNL